MAQEISNKSIFSRKTEIEEPQSTIGIEVNDFDKLNILNNVEVAIWDFAGQLEYASNHQVCRMGEV